MKSTSLFFVFLLVAASTFAQQAKPDPKYKMLYADNYVSSKNYYFLNLIDQLKPLKALVAQDVVLIKINKAKRQEIQLALKDCSQEQNCLVKALQLKILYIET